MKLANCSTAPRILRPPEAPTPNHGLPSRATTTGHILVRARLPDDIEFGRPGRGSNHITPLFIRIPVPASTYRLPKEDSNVVVSAAMPPFRSAAVMCVVEVREPVSASPMLSSRSA